MKIHKTFIRLLGLSAFATLLAACGGGGGSSAVPHIGAPSNANKIATGFTAFIPASSGTSSTARSPKYIDASGTSSLLVSVTPSDPAEFAQWGTFSVCYNLFTNGVASPSTGVTITPVGGGFNVTFNFPAPPGQDAMVLTQYAGACSATNPYAAPTPGPGQSAANLIISQSPVMNIIVNQGAANNFNTQLAACTAAPAAPVLPTLPTCPVPNPAGTTTLTPALGAIIASVYLGGAAPAPAVLPNPIPLPIKAPVREQGAFILAGNQVAMPLPVVGLDSNGNPVPYTKGSTPGTNPSSGFLPKAPLNPACLAGCTDAITLSSGANAHGHLVMLDAKTGAVIQTEAAAAPITITALNGLDTTDQNYGTAHPPGGGGTLDDQYVVALVYDGTAATQVSSFTITLGGQVNGAAVPAQTLTIKPQSAVYSATNAAGAAAGNGYNDAAGVYTAAADVISTFGRGLGVPASGIWVTDGASVAEVGTGHFAVAGAGALTGLNLDMFVGTTPALPAMLVAVDGSVAGLAPGAAPVAGGLYMVNPAAPAPGTTKPVAVQNVTGSYIQYAKPVGVAAAANGYLYIAENNNIVALNVVDNGAGALATVGGGAFYLADQIGGLTYASGSTAPNFGTATGIDMVMSGGNTITFADPGNNRIAQIDVSTCGPQATGANLGACTVTTIASGHPFVGVSAVGANYVASDTGGQLYLIGGGGTVSSFGLATGSVIDGALGVVAPPAATTAASPYVLQGAANNFFSTTATFTPTLPYNIPAFNAAAPVFIAAPAVGLKITADTSWNTVTGTLPGSAKKPFGIMFVPAANAAGVVGLTADSYVFADNGNLRTLIP